MRNSSISERLERHAPLLILAAGIVLLMPSIWSETSVTGQVEFWLSFRTPMETIARGDWLTPWVNGEPRLKKPPLLYWAIMSSYKVLGISFFAARIWGVLAGAGMAMCSCLLAREIFGKNMLLTGLVTLASIGVVVQGRQALLDLPLAFFTSLAVYFAIKWGKSSRLPHILSSAFSLGMAVMIKGPIGLYFFGASILSGLWVFKKWRQALSHYGHIILALLLILAVSLPWPIAMSFLWKNYYATVSEEIGGRHFGNFSFISPFSALGGALGLVFPWTLIFIAAVIDTLRHWGEDAHRRNIWLIAWYVMSTIPFFAMQSFERYMLPVVPAMCLLCSQWIERMAGEGKTLILQISIYLTAIIAVFLCLFLLWFGLGVFPALLCLVAVLGTLCGIHLAADVRILVGSVAVLLAVVMGGLYPSLGINAMPSDIPQIVGNLPAALYHTSQPSMLSMRLSRSVVPLSMSIRTGVHAFDRFDGFVFLEESDSDEFEAAAKRLQVEYRKEGQYRTFFSRRAWLRFVKRGATLEDWTDAIKTRSLDNLKSGICYYRVHPKVTGQ